ncbi:hypothetical protein [Crocosphaera chwakensis]|uniref:Uncharacterized protein n=1 Tax=Crocosphaera chwakensis CCY0110 TaxID=391612 RepID=A3IVL1_9CHRO|nr:hypothetical protein [Crocosphaera chwakensis]EAZ89486.1 hypothetical protein CY0110_01545 [Crocosphaera chwakensis CCY0110]
MLNNRDYSNSNAAKQSFCCVCGKHCTQQEIYFPKTVQCLNCYQLQDFLASKRYFIIPYDVAKHL